MSLLGPWYNAIDNEYGAYVIPFFILVIISIPTLFFINYMFVYKDFEVSKNKKMKLSFLTALANAPYSLSIALYHGPKRDIVSAIKNPKINSTKFSTILM